MTLSCLQPIAPHVSGRNDKLKKKRHKYMNVSDMLSTVVDGGNKFKKGKDTVLTFGDQSEMCIWVMGTLRRAGSPYLVVGRRRGSGVHKGRALEDQ